MARVCGYTCLTNGTKAQSMITKKNYCIIPTIIIFRNVVSQLFYDDKFIVFVGFLNKKDKKNGKCIIFISFLTT